MNPDRSRKTQPRSRGPWIALVVVVGAALLIAGGMTLRQHHILQDQLASHQRELAELQHRTDAIARASDELVQEHVLTALRRAHPAVEALARDEAGRIRLVNLHRAGTGSRGGHGFLVWNAAHTRGVLVVSPLPELDSQSAYHLVAHSESGGSSVVLATFRQETAVPFTVPPDVTVNHLEVVQAPASQPAAPSAKRLLTSAEARS